MELTVNENLAFGNVASQVRDRVRDVVVGHGQDGNLGDGAVATSDTAGTLVKAAEVLKERGAKSVYAYCTHAVFSGPAIERIKASHLDEVVITNTIPLSETAKGTPKVRQLSTAFLFAETIRRITDGDSVTSLFSEQNNNF